MKTSSMLTTMLIASISLGRDRTLKLEADSDREAFLTADSSLSKGSERNGTNELKLAERRRASLVANRTSQA